MQWSASDAARAALVAAVAVLGLGIATLATLAHASSTTLYILQGLSVGLVVVLMGELWWLWPDQDDETRIARRLGRQRRKLKTQNVALEHELNQLKAQGATGEAATPWRNPGRVKFLQIVAKPAVTNPTYDKLRAPRWYFAQRVGESGGVVVVLPLTRDDHVLLIEQYRSPVDARVLELPAGLVAPAPPGETEEDRVQRLFQSAVAELAQETKHITPEFLTWYPRPKDSPTPVLPRKDVPRWTGPVIEGPTSAGLTDESFSLFVARDVVPIPGAEGADLSRLGVAAEGENIQLHRVPRVSFDAWIEDYVRTYATRYPDFPPLQVDPKVYFVKLFL